MAIQDFLKAYARLLCVFFPLIFPKFMLNLNHNELCYSLYNSAWVDNFNQDLEIIGS